MQFSLSGGHLYEGGETVAKSILNPLSGGEGDGCEARKTRRDGRKYVRNARSSERKKHDKFSTRVQCI